MGAKADQRRDIFHAVPLTLALSHQGRGNIKLSQRCGDVAAVDGHDGGGGFA